MVTVVVPDDNLHFFQLTQNYIDGTGPAPLESELELVTQEDGIASFYISVDDDAICQSGSYPVLAGTAYAVDYGLVTLVADPSCTGN